MAGIEGGLTVAVTSAIPLESPDPSEDGFRYRLRLEEDGRLEEIEVVVSATDAMRIGADPEEGPSLKWVWERFEELDFAPYKGPRIDQLAALPSPFPIRPNYGD